MLRTVTAALAASALLLPLAAGQPLFGAECNMTEYELWLQRPNDFGAIFVTFPIDNPLTNELTMSLAASQCRQQMQNVITREAGKRGSPDDRFIWDTMCGEACLLSDQFHDEAMRVSGCNCAELSTQPDSMFYDPLTQHDFCRESTGYLACNILERCGIWECNVTDFGCYRSEYDKTYTAQRGFGSCSAGAALRSNFALRLAVVVGLCLMLIL